VLEFWTLQLRPTFDDYVLGLLQEYEQSHRGVRIRWVDVPYDMGTPKLLSALASHHPPDVVNLFSDQLPEFASRNALAVLDALVEEKVRARYLEQAWRRGVFRGRTFAIPWYLSTDVTIYNRQLLADAGFDSTEVPRTTEALLQFARTYRERTRKFAFFFPLAREDYFLQMLASEGVAILSQEGTHALFNSPRGVEVADQWITLFRHGYLPREALTETHRIAIEQYQSGQVALFVSGPQFLKLIQENAPSVYAQTDVAPAITGKTGKLNLAVMQLAVLGASAHRREAVDFALFVTNPKNQLKFCQIVAILPSTRETLRDPFFERPDGTLEAKARSVAAQQLRVAEPLLPHLPNFVKLRQIFQEAIQEACLGKRTTKEALDEAARQWNQTLAASAR